MEYLLIPIPNESSDVSKFHPELISRLMTAIDFEEDETPLIGEITRLAALCMYDTRYLDPDFPTGTIKHIYAIDGYEEIPNRNKNVVFLGGPIDIPSHIQTKLFGLCGFTAKMLQRFNWPTKGSLIHFELILAYWNYLHQDNKLDKMWIDSSIDIRYLFEKYFNIVTRTSILVRSQ
jgi:hypothetical protein